MNNLQSESPDFHPERKYHVKHRLMEKIKKQTVPSQKAQKRKTFFP